MTTITLKLSDEWQRFLLDCVERKTFPSVQAALDFALVLLKDDLEENGELVALIAEGEASGPPVPWDLKEFFAEMEEGEADRKAA